MSSRTLLPAVEVFADDRPLELDLCAQGSQSATLETPHLAYELCGPVDAPLVVVLGGISAGSHVCAHEGNTAAGWWDGIVGASKPIALEKYRVLGIDWLGGAGASQGPVRGSCELFPPLTSRDQARILARLLESLGYQGSQAVHAIVGSSYGGMVALAFGELYSDLVERLVVLCAAHTSDPWTTGSRSLARRVLRLGLCMWDDELTREALSIVRGLGMLSYRTKEEFAERFGDDDFVVETRGSDASLVRGECARFPVEDYLEARGRDFAADFSAEAVHSLSQSIDLHRVVPEDVRVRTWVAAARSDQLVTWTLVSQLVERLADCQAFVELDSKFGHDAFLKEIAQVGDFVAGALAQPVARRGVRS